MKGISMQRYLIPSLYFCADASPWLLAEQKVGDTETSSCFAQTRKQGKCSWGWFTNGNFQWRLIPQWPLICETAGFSCGKKAVSFSPGLVRSVSWLFFNDKLPKQPDSGMSCLPRRTLMLKKIPLGNMAFIV
jgi:hypothetical protein